MRTKSYPLHHVLWACSPVRRHRRPRQGATRCRRRGRWSALPRTCPTDWQGVSALGDLALGSADGPWAPACQLGGLQLGDGFGDVSALVPAACLQVHGSALPPSCDALVDADPLVAVSGLLPEGRRDEE